MNLKANRDIPRTSLTVLTGCIRNALDVVYLIAMAISYQLA